LIGKATIREPEGLKMVQPRLATAPSGRKNKASIEDTQRKRIWRMPAAERRSTKTEDCGN